jgi:hypothetical protein
MKYRWASRLLTGAALAASVIGCAQEREPINRVQSMALKKSFFLGDNLADQSDNPEFYTQQFITDVPYGAGQDGLFTVGYGGKLTRVKFEATENYLIARITYERIDDSDGKGVDPQMRDGVIAGMFPILSHFDIRRSYNPQTGEEMNVIEENQSDRPWYEREYFRVDWSQNLNTDAYDFDSLAEIGIIGGIKYEPLRYEVTDPSAPDAPHFSVDDGYFDITNKAFAAPQMIDISKFGWGINEMPACWGDADFMGGTGPAGTCNPVEITVRLSFKKVVDSDYEPQDWDGYRFQAYGAFYTDRYGYSADYGLSDDKWHRFIDRYNIWERSHYYADPVAMTGEVPCNTMATTGVGGDPHRDVLGAKDDQGNDLANGTEDECEDVTRLTGVAGSRCDEFKHKCTLPYRARKTKTIAWHFTNSDPQIVGEYFEPTGWAAHEWDVALRSAVQAARYAECKRTGEGNCETQYPVFRGQAADNDDAVAIAREVDMCNQRAGYPEQLPAQCAQIADDLAAKRLAGVGVADVAKLPEMLTLCHSPVQDDDSPACGARGTIARIGDLRYHNVNVLPNPQTPSPWGIMVDSIDPTSGETVMAAINCFSFVNDLWSQGVVDYARYINGELSTADITDGTNVRNWVQADRLAHQGGGGIMPQLTADQRIEQLASVANVDVETMKSVVANREQFHKLPIYNQLRQYTQRLNNDIEAAQGAPSQQRAIVEARLNNARGTEFEAKLMSTPVLQRAGLFNSSVPLNSTTTDYVSPLRMNNPQFELEWHRMMDNARAKRGMCVMNEAPEGTGITALADMLKWKFPPADAESPGQTYDRIEAMRGYLKKKVHYAVIVHEMGHSIGLRHNFVSSYDAFSFHPQYWQLRTRDGADLPECTQLTNDGNSCTGPRYYDPVTPEEHDGVITMWMHDSVMDYSGTAEGDLIGLGGYDFAAARMFYGETVAVADRDDIRVDSAVGGGLLDKMDNFGGIIGIQPGIVQSGAIQNFHYSQYQKNFKMISDCQEVPDINAFIPSDWDDKVMGPWHPTVDGRVVRVNGKYTKCKEIPVDHVFYKDLRFPTIKEQAPLGYYRGGPAVDPANRVRIPYGFATDSWADLGNLSVYRHDVGADPYELFQFFITQQETRHIWDNYRRGRQTFSVRNASNRAFERYNAKMRDGAKGLGLYATLYRNFATAQGYDYNTLWPYIVADQFGDNVLASGMAFDHFARELQRPHIGDHYAGTASTGGIYLAADDGEGQPGLGDRHVFIPNGATGFFRDVGIGGRPVNNTLSDNHGEYDRDYTLNAGSYYSKINAPILLCESVDNFISSSRNDFVDPRYRAVSVADLFPEGFRRLVANALTLDNFITGERVAANAQGLPVVDIQNYPARPIGWTSWWPKEGPKVCMPSDGTTVCYSMGNQTGLQPYQPEGYAVIDSQIGWEQQKHLIAQMLLYLPENSMQRWLEMMTIYELGVDPDPGADNRIEFHNPISGKIYVAHTYGTESIFGHDGLQKGIAARMLQYANSLVAAGFKLETDPDKVAPDNDHDGQPDWPTVKHHPDGFPVIIADSRQIGANGSLAAIKQCDRSLPATDPNYDPTCREIQCEESKACVKLQRYIETIFFLRQAIHAYGLDNIETKGVYQ